MTGMKKFLLSAAMAAGTMGMSTLPAQAARVHVGVFVGEPVAYVPPSPGPGYVWVDGYWNGGYWTPGYWNFVGGGYGYNGYVGNYGYTNGYAYRDRDDHRNFDNDRGRNQDWDRGGDRDRGGDHDRR